jgi:uncharacterized SAM-binding protein YcdF (DUF218 family)
VFFHAKIASMQYDVGIILSHFYGPLIGFSNRQKKRMDKGIELLSKGQVRLLMTTGGTGLFNPTPRPFGQLAKGYLVKNGVSEHKILVEDRSVNTDQNAEFALELVKKENLKSAIVITSADHMIRAKRIFKEIFPQDFKIDFVISDYVSGIWTLWDCLWHTAAWIKYRVKRLVG